MPWAPKKPCADCSTLVPSGTVRCVRHEQASQHRRNLARGGSGWAWEQWRQAAIARDGGCVKEGPHGQGKLGELRVNHILPLADGGKTELDNLETVCRLHDIGITRAWRRARA